MLENDDVSPGPSRTSPRRRLEKPSWLSSLLSFLRCNQSGFIAMHEIRPLPKKQINHARLVRHEKACYIEKKYHAYTRPEKQFLHQRKVRFFLGGGEEEEGWGRRGEGRE